MEHDDLIGSIILLDKNYSGEELSDVSRDIEEAIDNLPKDEDGLLKGKKINVSIQYYL